MRHVCLGISNSEMSRGRASEKAPKIPLATGLPAGGVKGDQDLNNGQTQGEGSSSLVRLDSDQGDEGRGGGLAHTPHCFLPQGHLKGTSRPGGIKQHGRWGWGTGRGKMPIGQLRKTGEREKKMNWENGRSLLHLQGPQILPKIGLKNKGQNFGLFWREPISLGRGRQASAGVSWINKSLPWALLHLTGSSHASLPSTAEDEGYQRVESRNSHCVPGPNPGVLAQVQTVSAFLLLLPQLLVFLCELLINQGISGHWEERAGECHSDRGVGRS